MLTFSRFSQLCQTLITGKGFGHVYKKKCPYTSPKCIFFVPPRSLLISKHDNTNYFGVTIIAYK